MPDHARPGSNEHLRTICPTTPDILEEKFNQVRPRPSCVRRQKSHPCPTASDHARPGLGENSRFYHTHNHVFGHWTPRCINSTLVQSSLILQSLIAKQPLNVTLFVLLMISVQSVIRSNSQLFRFIHHYFCPWLLRAARQWMVFTQTTPPPPEFHGFYVSVIT